MVVAHKLPLLAYVMSWVGLHALADDGVNLLMIYLGCMAMHGMVCVRKVQAC